MFTDYNLILNSKKKSLMKNILILFILITLPFSLLSQRKEYLKMSCEELGNAAQNNDKTINVQIAYACKKVWEKNIGLLLTGPHGTYKRHIYNGTATITRDVLGNILKRKVEAYVFIEAKKGGCKLAFIELTQNYIGGGEYASFDIYEPRWVSDDIDCNSIECIRDWIGTSSPKSSGGSSDSKKSSEPTQTAIKDGPYEYKSPSGDYAEKGTYSNGQKTGLWTQYGSDGKISSEKNYLNGKLDGESKQYTNDVLRKSEEYKDDKRDGVVKEFDDAGNPLSSTEYKNGKKHGKETLYKNGEIASEREFLEGEKNGKSIEYRSGKKYEEVTYVKGKKNGESIKYYIETGTVQSIENYTDDKRNGIYKSYSKTGKLETEGNYKGGLKDGEWKKYDADGKVIEKLFYVDGKQEK